VPGRTGAAKDDVGRRGEALAERLLVDEGYVVLARNWRGRGGELDVVALDGDILVAVEVKTRSSLRYGHPAEAVDGRKVDRLRRLTGPWLAEQGGVPGSGPVASTDAATGPGPGPRRRRRFAGIRIDVVAVVLPDDGLASAQLLRGVI
jgi:putative endonuclease